MLIVRDEFLSAADGKGGALQPRVPALDGVRGLAIALVLLAHVGGVDGAGLVGVLVFFVLSGYLITWLLIGEHDRNGGIALRDFYWRRVARLLPGLVAFLAAFVLVAGVFDVGVTRSDALHGVIQGLTYVTDFTLGLQAGYVPELAHLWSLAVEEQFYLVWPLALIALLRGWGQGRRLRLLVTVTVMAAVLRIVTMAVAPALGLFIYALPTTWVDALLIGALCAVLRKDESVAAQRLATFAKRGDVLVVALALIAAFALVPGSYRWTGTYLVGIPLLSAATGIVILGIADGKAPSVLSFLGSRPIGSLGVVSYSLYLYNSTCIMLVQRVFGMGLVQRLAGLVLAVTLAYLSYRFIERPVLSLHRRRVRDRRRCEGVVPRMTIAGAQAD